jgi:hypothetical protein
MIWSFLGSPVDPVKRFFSAILWRRPWRNPINRFYFSELRALDCRGLFQRLIGSYEASGHEHCSDRLKNQAVFGVSDHQVLKPCDQIRPTDP